MTTRAILLWFFVVSLLWVASILKPFILPLVAGFFVAMLVMPLVYRLQKKGVGEKWAIISVVSGIILVSVGFPLFLGLMASVFGSQISDLGQLFLDQFSSVQVWISSNMDLDIQGQRAWLQENISGFLSPGTNGAPSAINGVMSFSSSVILAIVYTIFLIVYEKHIIKSISKSFSIPYARLQKEVVNIQTTFGQFIWSMSIVVGILAALYSITLAIVGVPRFVLVGLFAAVTAFVPTVGTFIGIAFAVAVTLITVSPASALVVLGVMLLIQIVEGYYITPHITGKNIELNMFVIILAIVGMGFLRGVVGMFLAIPMLAISRSIAHQYRRRSNIAQFIDTFLG